MTEFNNLPLVRIDVEYDRRKHGFGNASSRNYNTHATKINNDVVELLNETKKNETKGLNPELILKISYANKIQADELRKCDLEVIGEDSNNALILFASDKELTEFRARLAQYQNGPKEGNKHPSYNQVFANIETVSTLTPQDRIGPKLSKIEIKNNDTYWVDIELWHLGSRQLCNEKIEEVRKIILTNQGRVTDNYIGKSIVVLRANLTGELVKILLEDSIVRLIDIPPKPYFNPREISNLTIDSFPEVIPPDPESTGVCVIDSGVMEGHPMIGPALGDSVSFPTEIGEPTDKEGHGTKVSGLALYGDVLKCINDGVFKPQARLFSARVTNEYNSFDDEKLITTQMRDAINYFYHEYGCRIFNISLGDSEKPYVEGKQTYWAATLDELIRELDIVVIVSAGNYFYDGEIEENVLSEYPTYLFDEKARIIDPASAALAITVGSYCAFESGPTVNLFRKETRVDARVIGKENHPSPFTRTGPGVQGSIKPELCEYGGNLIFDGLIGRINVDRALSVVSTSKELPNELFTTDIGTSFAAPVSTYKASRILNVFKGASANLVRAILVHSAEYPKGIDDTFTEDELLKMYGYGVAQVERFLTSNNQRVTLFAETTIELDKFHIFEVPIPKDFNEVRGKRFICATLAFDPPTRHTRLDYLGITMSYRLIRGKGIDEVVNFFKPKNQVDTDLDERVPSANNCKLIPTPTVREKCTVQKSTFTASNPLDYGDTYYLVVRCESKWATEEVSPQKYALVVTLEHTKEEVDLYTEISQRVQESISLRERVRVKKVRVKI
ncbi:S8 family peptidase [Cytobacillus sp. NCCP-133]|uniref:S8 family peptidase n=1 Tax=Cytobacillus sp. NCCP-133 TaxID=766848 RepID=UPI00222E1B30|nr:S8 family peptidase [Cytobacillus sp. NCCP-133]GLB59180.1 hypothetical protein NCCP133_13130 [Cytobacillus sp. NCCP-133]